MSSNPFEGFDDVDSNPSGDDVIGNYTGMQCCIGYIGDTPQFIDQKELSQENVDKACKHLKLDPTNLSFIHLAQAVKKWIDAGRPEPQSVNNNQLSLGDFF